MQEVRVGTKNTLPFADKSLTINGMEIKCIDGELILNGTTTAEVLTSNDFFKNNFKFKLEAGDYCFSVKEQPKISPIIKKVSDDSLIISLNVKEVTFSLTEDTEAYFSLYIPTGKTFNNFNYEFMLEKDATTRTTYEPVGTPSILIPSDIRNVGDNINLINIYDINEEGFTVTKYGIEFMFLSNGGIKLNGTSTQTSSIPLIGVYQSGNFKINLNGKYTQSGLEDGVSILYYNGTKLVGRFYNKETKEINYKIDYAILSIDSGKSFNNVIIYPKLEQGSKTTPYTPYNCGSVDLLVQNRNLFNGKFINGQINSTTGQIVASENIVSSQDFIKVKANKTVYFSNNGVAVKVNIIQYKLDGTCVGKVATADKYTFTEDCLIRFYRGNTSYDKLQVEYDGVTDYIEGKSQTVVFPLSEGQLLHKGDYLEEDGIHQTRTTVNINEKSNFIVTSELEKTIRYAYTDMYVKENAISVCDKLKYKSNNLLDEEHIGTGVNNKRIYLWINKSRLNTYDVVGLQEYLKDNPLVVETELAEEIIIPYTEEQQTAYNQIKELYSYTGTTHINCIDEISCNFDIEYRKDYTIAQDNLQKQIDKIKASLVSEVVE